MRLGRARSARRKISVTITHRPLSSSFLGWPYRILNINHKKELLRGLWVSPCSQLHEQSVWTLRVSSPQKSSTE